MNMALNKQKGEMYDWCSYTWNPIKGVCPHKCEYCYMRRLKTGKLRIDEKCLKDNLDRGGLIFVGSSIDMFADDIPHKWIKRVLDYCAKFKNPTFLFQSKNPIRFIEFLQYFPEKSILGTTIETNRDYNLCVAQKPRQRAYAMNNMTNNKMVSIEPVVDFDLNEMIKYIKLVNPSFVSIGADTKNSKLIEPISDKLERLIYELDEFTEVKIKDNIKRILN